MSTKSETKVKNVEETIKEKTFSSFINFNLIANYNVVGKHLHAVMARDSVSGYQVISYLP